MVADTLALCAIAAPTGDEAERGRAVEALLRDAGAAPHTDAAGNVLARFGPPDGPATVIAAHLDTVFPAGTPLAPRRADGSLHGPGIGDDCLGLGGLVHAARVLAAGTAPAHPVLLAATVGEEGLGDLRGARALLDAHACDAFVALEGHGRDTLQAAAAAAAGDAHINIGVVGGGTSINTIAAHAEAEIDLRDAVDAALEATRERVVAALHDALPAGVQLAVEPIGRRPAGVTPADHPLVRAAREARARAGLPPAEEQASSTDANAALGRGIPAICLGLTHGANAHRTDERVELAPLEGGLATLEGLVRTLARGL